MMCIFCANQKVRCFTVLVMSHSPEDFIRYCNRAISIENHMVKAVGESVSNQYSKQVEGAAN